MVEASSQQPLHVKYPIASKWKFKLTNGESVEGEVYCTDPVADILVLQGPENDIRMVSLSSIEEAKAESSTRIEPPKIDMVHVKKVLEEREKRAIRLAQESLKHLNPKAPPKGQIVFDRLLKACNDVVWKKDSIVVLDSIVVEPPYTKDDCKQLKSSKQQGSLDRVQKIVSSING